MEDDVGATRAAGRMSPKHPCRVTQGEEENNVFERRGYVALSASGQIMQASQNVAQATSEQASGIEETSSSLEEITSMTKQNASHPEQANGIMGEVNDNVIQGKQSDENAARIHERDETILRCNL